MDTILVTITGLSIAVAAGMAVMLVRMRRIDRQRSDARIALLEELAAPHPQARPSRPVAPSSVSLDDFELRPAYSADPEGPSIFQEHEHPSAWPRRFAIVGTLAAILAGVFFGWGALDHSAPGTDATSLASAQRDPEPLELLSLQHAQEAGTLVITGVVQNPRTNRPLNSVQATVALFGTGGESLASGRAPLDFTTLAPGGESPFVIRVPVAAGVSRYRVGFRAENDHLLGHVDRRNNEAVARKQAP